MISSYNDFSVVITTKNRLGFLKRCVGSIYNSEIWPKEIIIVNDCGDLVTEDIFSSYKSLNILVINNPISMGANYCRNVGGRSSSSSILFFMDDDDYFEKSTFLNRMKLFEQREHIDLIYTGCSFRSSENLNKELRKTIPKRHEGNDYFNSLIEKGNIIGSTSRVAIRKKSFIEVDGFDESLSSFQDFDLWLRVARYGKITSEEQAGIRYTIHKKNQGHQQISRQYNKYLKDADYIIKKYSTYDYFDKNKIKKLESSLYLRIALSAIENPLICKKYSALSFVKRPNVKALVVSLIPYSIISKIYNFV